MTVEIAHTLAFLLGRWSIERVIDDRRAAAVITFSGTADVVGTEAGALYTETGRVTASGHTGPARRTLRLSPLPAGAVRFDFADGRPFIDVDLADGHASAIHPCRADSYEMDFSVGGPDELRERWRVTGPEKDYSAETIWRRI